MSNSIVIGYRKNAHAPTLYHYIHWSDLEPADAVVRALKHSQPRWRWSDEGYATRMAISITIGTEQLLSDSGHGLYIESFPMCDAEYIPIILWEEKRVRVYKYDRSVGEMREFLYEMEFEQYINYTF